MAMSAPGVPQYLGPRMNALPRVSAGPMASAEAFGAGNARELMRLADAGQKLGLSILARAQEEQKRLDQACVRDEMNQMRMAMLEDSQDIFNLQGLDAQDAPQRMQALLSGVQGRSGGACPPGSRLCSTGGGNIEYQRMRQDAMAGLSRDYMMSATRHKIKQARVYERQSLDMQDRALDLELESMLTGRSIVTGTALDPVEDGYLPASGGELETVGGSWEAPPGATGADEAFGIDGEEEAVAPDVAQRVEAELMPQPHFGDEIAKRIQLKRHNARLRNAGYHPDYIRMKEDEAENTIHSLVADILTKQSPQQALDYLNDERVRAVMPRAQWAKRRNTAAAVVRNTEIPRLAMEAHEAGLSSTEAYKASLKFPDAKDRKAFLDNFDDYAKRAESVAKAETADKKVDIITNYIAAGYDIDRMPAADRAAIRSDKGLSDEVNGLRKVLADLNLLSKNPVPNFPELDNIRKLAKDEINDWITQPGNYARLMIWDAGNNTDELKEILDKRMGKTAGESGSNALDVNDMFRQSFGSINTTWHGSAVAYNPKDSEHARQEGNFRAIYKHRVGMEQETLGRKLTYAEQSDRFFRLMREVRTGITKLDRPIADGDPLAAMDAPARVESVNPATGKKEVTFASQAEGGEPETFEVIPPRVAASAYNIPGAKEGYVATAPGERFGLAYEAGDRIIVTVNPRTGKQDGVAIYDEEYKFKVARAGGGFASSTEDFAGKRTAPLPSPEPAKSPKMKAWEKDKGAEFVWNKHFNEFTAAVPNADDPSVMTVYHADADGASIYASPFPVTADTDAADAPAEQAAAEPERVAQVRRKIETLEAEVARMDRDPRTRKDIAHDKREEIRRLREEYNRISGANARASRFYVGANATPYPEKNP